MTAIKCPKCKSARIVKRGKAANKGRGKQQRYLCRGCNKTFVRDMGFWKMKNKEKIIAMCIDMYLSNLSSRKMRNQLKRHFGIKVSHITILNWVRKYTLKVYALAEKMMYPKLGGIFYADETVIRRGGNDDKFWACVDWKTRMITGMHYSIRTEIKDAVAFLKKAVSKGKPNYIQTDAAQFYPKAFVKTFYSRRDRILEVNHRIQNFNATGVHNYKIETVFMKIKDRVIDFRGLKALWSAPILMAGIVIQHNLIERHSTTNKVPAELAGMQLKVGENRWLSLIRTSAMKLA